MSDTTRASRMEAALAAAFPASRIDVIDESALHHGHVGAAPSGETHYRIEMVAAGFEAMPRLARSRLVHATLGSEFASGLHALSLTLRSPSEAQAIADAHVRPAVPDPSLTPGRAGTAR